ncbi:MAG: hypothetical protein FWF67_02220 [Fibromonadales bacterium]|nr:hypothetical protein [Fibromonadales bacterium]
MDKKKELTAADVWAMFAETDKRMEKSWEESDLRMRETDRIVRESILETGNFPSAKKLQKKQKDTA